VAAYGEYLLTAVTWAIGMLLGTLAASLGVAVYIAHPIPDWEIPGEMTLGLKAYREGVTFKEHLGDLVQAMEKGVKHNSSVLDKRFKAFERLLYFLITLLAAAVITYLATR
jgi:hypothetical protein